MAENQSSLQELQGRSQYFTFPRRELLQKIVSAALLCLVPRRQPVNYAFSERPLPKFSIGDLIAADWVDEFDENIVEFGEVVGLCYLHEGGRSYPDNNWVYYIRWTHSSSGPDSPGFPCFEWEPSTGDDWRLVSHA